MGPKDISFVQSVLTSSDAHPTLYTMDNAGSFHGHRVTRHEADHLPPASAAVNALHRTITPFPPMSSRNGDQSSTETT